MSTRSLATDGRASLNFVEWRQLPPAAFGCGTSSRLFHHAKGPTIVRSNAFAEDSVRRTIGWRPPNWFRNLARSARKDVWALAVLRSRSPERRRWPPGGDFRNGSMPACIGEREVGGGAASSERHHFRPETPLRRSALLRPVALCGASAGGEGVSVPPAIGGDDDRVGAAVSRGGAERARPPARARPAPTASDVRLRGSCGTGATPAAAPGPVPASSEPKEIHRSRAHLRDQCCNLAIKAGAAGGLRAG